MTVLVPAEPPKSLNLSRSEVASWRELATTLNASGGAIAAKMAGFANLVRAQSKLNDPELPVGAYANLAGLVNAALSALTPRPRSADQALSQPVVGTQPVVDARSEEEEGPFDPDDGFPSLLPLQFFGPEHWIMDAPGGPKLRPEAIAEGRREWRRIQAQRQGLDGSL
jgi:hypothetical protein